MHASVRSAAVNGIEASEVIVELDAAMGLPSWTIVGLPENAVKESRERVHAALANSAFTVPARRMTVNLAPADTKKVGTAFDLPIALALLAATGQLDPQVLRDLVIVGELGLDGAIRGVRGMLSIARHVARSPSDRLFVPHANLGEATLMAPLVDRLLSCVPALDLRSICRHTMRGRRTRGWTSPRSLGNSPPSVHSKSQRRVAITSCCWVHQDPGRRCWHDASRRYCQAYPKTKPWTSSRCNQWRAFWHRIR